MRRTVTLVLVATLSLEACVGGHVQLPPAPPREAPLPVRVQAYNRFRPVAMQETLTIQMNRYGGVTNSSTTLDNVRLADGTAVVYPEDLAPMVDPSSVTAQASRRSVALREPGLWLEAGGGLALLVGLGMVFPAALTTTDNPDGTTTRGDSALLWTSVGFMSVGLIAALIGLGYSAGSSSERQRAFMTYDNSLREHLGLCGDGTQIGDCVNAGATQ